MLKFENTHIFTGYLKQLLSTFNLPTCKIYTREFANYFIQNGKEDPRVIESFNTIPGLYSASGDPTKQNCLATRVNYLKGNDIYNYLWTYSKDSPNLNHDKTFWKQATTMYYENDRSKQGLTKTLHSPGITYDTVTHEYLGDYLRFLRDYHNVNLMSLYNCFSNKIYNNINYRFYPNARAEEVVFDSRDPKYHIYALPVKLFSNYTIAIDCDQGIEVFCGFYKTYLSGAVGGSDKFENLAKRTYRKFDKLIFRQPRLYDNLDVKNWNFEQDTKKDANNVSQLENPNIITRWDIANRENDLKLFIKVPVCCKSSITILEGDFRHFNDFRYVPEKQVLSGTETANWKYYQNQCIINFDNKTTADEPYFKPISKLQLLALNTGESFPFADRLIEYLSGSAITPLDELPDNIRRVQKVMNQNNHYFKIEGLWEDKMQKIIYDYLINSGPIEVETLDGKPKLKDTRQGYHRGVGHNSKSTLYDTLGYIDKEAEKWYASWKKDGNDSPKVKVRDTIQNIGIYDGLYET